jgi:hypothetical protein
MGQQPISKEHRQPAEKAQDRLVDMSNVTSVKTNLPHSR